MLDSLFCRYRPTWFATPPNTKYTYLCDGYGSNHVYAFDRETGVYLNKTWGGRSPKAGVDAPHGTFSTNHGCTYDPRIENTIIVSDRANHRFEFFNYDPSTYTEFEWSVALPLAATFALWESSMLLLCKFLSCLWRRRLTLVLGTVRGSGDLDDLAEGSQLVAR